MHTLPVNQNQRNLLLKRQKNSHSHPIGVSLFNWKRTVMRHAEPPSRNGLSHANRCRNADMAEELFWQTLNSSSSRSSRLFNWPTFSAIMKMPCSGRYSNLFCQRPHLSLANHAVPFCMPRRHVARQSRRAACKVAWFAASTTTTSTPGQRSVSPALPSRSRWLMNYSG